MPSSAGSVVSNVSALFSRSLKILKSRLDVPPVDAPVVLPTSLILLQWVLQSDGFHPVQSSPSDLSLFEFDGPCSSLSASSWNLGMSNVPADLSSSSPWTTLISSQPKGARKILVCNTPRSFHLFFSHWSGLLRLQAIQSCLSSSLELSLVPLHSSSNPSGLGVAALLIRLPRRLIRVRKSCVL